MNFEPREIKNAHDEDTAPKKKGFLYHFPLWCIVPFCIALIFLVFHIISRNNVRFATFFCDNISYLYRMIFAKLTSPLPFSLGETFFISLPVIVALFMLWSYKQVKRGYTARPFAALICAASVLYSIFVLNFACSYGAEKLDKRLDIEKIPVTTDELYFTASCLAEQTNFYSESLDFKADGFSVMPHSYKALSAKLCTSFERLHKEYSFIQDFRSRVKPVALSVPMSYAHITGIYFPFTGEANINIDFPDYSIPFTAAHELAHQRGVAREDEANFIAFLACMESDDPYILYSGSLNMLEYVLNALARADKDLYSEVYFSLNENVRGELRAYSLFFEKYRDSTASKVNEAVNDTYLKVQGTEGVVSYGMVVDLAVAYYAQLAEQ